MPPKLFGVQFITKARMVTDPVIKSREVKAIRIVSIVPGVRHLSGMNIVYQLKELREKLALNAAKI